MRLTLTFICAAGLALAANAPQEITYVEGTLDGFSLATQTTLQASAKNMVLHPKGGNDVAISYMNVTGLTRTTVPVSVEKEPLYKVWELPKRLAPPAPVEKVALQFVDEKGARQSVTFETDKKTANKVLTNVKKAENKRASDGGAWWGDGIWKTKRNQGDWGSAGPIASRE